jgi:hypothetical protein
VVVDDSIHRRADSGSTAAFHAMSGASRARPFAFQDIFWALGEEKYFTG